MITMNWTSIGLNQVLLKSPEMTFVVILCFINKLNWIELLVLTLFNSLLRVYGLKGNHISISGNWASGGQVEVNSTEAPCKQQGSTVSAADETE